jgi:hypothetical protein
MVPAPDDVAVAAVVGESPWPASPALPFELGVCPILALLSTPAAAAVLPTPIALGVPAELDELVLLEVPATPALATESLELELELALVTPPICPPTLRPENGI